MTAKTFLAALVFGTIAAAHNYSQALYQVELSRDYSILPEIGIYRLWVETTNMLENLRDVEVSLSGRRENHPILRTPYHLVGAVQIAILIYAYFQFKDTDVWALVSTLLACSFLNFGYFAATAYLASKEGVSKGKMALSKLPLAGIIGAVYTTQNRITGYNPAISVGTEFITKNRIAGNTSAIAQIKSYGRDENGEYLIIEGGWKLFGGLKIYIGKAEFEKAVEEAEKRFMPSS